MSSRSISTVTGGFAVPPNEGVTLGDGEGGVGGISSVEVYSGEAPPFVVRGRLFAADELSWRGQ